MSSNETGILNTERVKRLNSWALSSA